ncbi:MAG: Rieske 2Fe-2S domain-containing protein [Dehalococcoidia bacterium]|nr:Rieske 2Fe-2S domain-containing protein [Dehalococcoidia bacterium]
MIGFESVGRVADFPQGYVRGFKLQDEEVAVVQVDGRFYAFSNACTHEDVDLADSMLNGVELACVFHGSVFNVETGKALAGPAYKPLALYSVRVEGEDVFVGEE